MEKKSDEKRYKLSREAVSRVLGVSVRTVDRYIKTKKLSTRLAEGRIWLDEGEVVAFRDGKRGRRDVDNVDTSKSVLSSGHDVDSVDKVVDKVDKMEMSGQEIVGGLFTHKKNKKESTDTFKKLYEDLKKEIQEKQERLELANYRVGQLEAQVRNSIPMLEYHKENYEKQKREEDLKIKLEESTGIIRRLSIKLNRTKFSKRLYIAILLIILALQPLWLLFGRLA